METVIQNPDLGVRTAGWKKRKLLRDGGWKEADLQLNGNGNPEPQSWVESRALKV